MPGSATSSARPTAIQSRKKISSRSHAWTASSWYAMAGSSVACRNGARMRSSASAAIGAGVRGAVGGTMAKAGPPSSPPDRSRRTCQRPIP